MKKTLLIVGVLSIAFISQIRAQEAEAPMAHPYNQWSIEAGAGFNKPVHAWTGNYSTETVSPYTLNVGARYMFNEFVGLKAMFSYDNIKSADNTPDFESKFYTYSLEGVANLGRIMKFESWTKTLNVLGHAGLGYSRLAPEAGMYNDEVDQMVNFRGGVTGEIKLSDKFAITGDISVLANIRQDLTWDGLNVDNHDNIQGIMFNGTVGLVYYMGKAKEHADWYVMNDNLQEQITGLDGRVTAIEGDLNDADGDGVADYLDKEPNSPTGATVDTHGVTVDKNNNGMVDSSESYLDNTYVRKDAAVANGNGDFLAKLLNDGYVSVFFDFDSSKVKLASSKDAINFISTYLKDNSSVNAELSGFADEVGATEYNNKLSEKRAQAVKSALVEAGIDAGRITIKGQGEVTDNAHYLARRVTVKLK
ncbi:MAG: OmpA family protein [Flavobacteriaceae bacterium]|nr:OmpA family protein [Flavobacteriaceae bacterium]